MIRELKKKDLVEYIKLINELVEEHKVNLVEIYAHFDKHNKRDDFIMIGFFDGDTILGTSTGLLLPDFTGDLRPILILENIVVKQSCRREGIGTKIVNYLEDYAKEKNCRAVSFISASKRKESHQFYQKVGYTNYPVKGFKKYL